MRNYKKIDCFASNILVHTGQNYDKNLHQVFFSRFKNLRCPDIQLECKSKISKKQIAKIIKETGNVMDKESLTQF